MTGPAAPQPDLSIYSASKVDGQFHVLDPDRFAWAGDVGYRPAGQETGSADHVAQVLDACGVQRALLAGPNSCYGTDTRCLLPVITARPERFKVLGPV